MCAREAERLRPARPASRSTRANRIEPKAAITLLVSKLGGSTSGRTRSPAISTATESPGRHWPTNCRAHSSASARGVELPPARSMLSEPSITITMSRGDDASPPRPDSSPARAWRDQYGRASASAIMASKPIRASIKSSSVRRSRRRAWRPSSRNCIAPQSITGSLLRLSKWMTIGTIAPASPASIAAFKIPQLTVTAPRRATARPSSQVMSSR